MAKFHEGDVIYVEGRLTADAAGAGHSADPYPRFHVERAWKANR